MNDNGKFAIKRKKYAVYVTGQSLYYHRAFSVISGEVQG